MKKSISYILIGSIFTTQNLFAQTETVPEEMDLKVYTKYILAWLCILIIILFAALAFSASKKPAISETTVKPFISNPINVSTGNSFYLLSSLSLELNRLRFMLISALIIFSIIFLLVII